jgi:hypothetical protein
MLPKPKTASLLLVVAIFASRLERGLITYFARCTFTLTPQNATLKLVYILRPQDGINIALRPSVEGMKDTNELHDWLFIGIMI